MAYVTPGQLERLLTLCKDVAACVVDTQVATALMKEIEETQKTRRFIFKLKLYEDIRTDGHIIGVIKSLRQASNARLAAQFLSALKECKSFVESQNRPVIEEWRNMSEEDALKLMSFFEQNGCLGCVKLDTIGMGEEVSERITERFNSLL